MAFASAQKLGWDQGEALTVGSTTLLKRLRDNKLLASCDSERQRLTVRRTLDGTRRDVLHLKTEAVIPEKPSQPSQSSQFDSEHQPGESPEGPDAASSGPSASYTRVAEDQGTMTNAINHEEMLENFMRAVQGHYEYEDEFHGE